MVRVPVATMLRLFRSPDLLARIIWGQVCRTLISGAQYRWGAGVSASLRQVDIKITNLCNLKCEMCAQWGRTGYNFGRPRDELAATVPLEIYQRMVEELASRKPMYYIWGGEPFLYPDLTSLAAYMKKRNATVSIISNGTLVREHAEKLVRMGVDNFMFSLDGPEDVHDRIRGVRGTAQKLAETVREINRWKKALNTPRPYIVFLMTLTPQTLEHVTSTMEIAESLKADFFGLYYSWFTSLQIGLEHQKLMKREFGCDATAWKGYVSDPSRFDAPRLIAELKRVRSRRWAFPYMAVPDLKEREIPRYFAEPGNTFGNTRCLSPWTATEIQPNGDVATCRDHPDYVVGNIQNEPLLRIFNNSHYRRFRRRLQTKGLMPVCARCCGLMGF
jgi:radical SAM protein with 4Fe4S-binding SPASM domain